MNFTFIFALLLLIPTLSWAQSRYVVRRGDTVLKIADRKLHITDKKDPRRYDYAKQVRKLNPEIKDLNQLEPGQSITLPEDSNEATAVAEHASEKDSPAVLIKENPALAPIHEVSANGETTTTHLPAPKAEDAEAASAAVTPAATPAASNSHPDSSEEHHANFFFIQPRYQMIHLEVENPATEGKASLKSKSSFGLDLQYGKIINDRFHLLLQGGVTQTAFQSPEDEATSLNHDSESLKSLGIGVAYEATHTLHLDFMFQYAERTFLLPGTSGTYKLEAVAIPGAELNLSWDLYSGSANIFGVSAIAEYIANAAKEDVDYKSALEPIGALYWRSNFGADRANYKATLMYKHGHQKTSVSEQKEELMSLGVGVYF